MNYWKTKFTFGEVFTEALTFRVLKLLVEMKKNGRMSAFIFEVLDSKGLSVALNSSKAQNLHEKPEN